MHDGFSGLIFENSGFRMILFAEIAGIGLGCYQFLQELARVIMKL